MKDTYGPSAGRGRPCSSKGGTIQGWDKGPWRVDERPCGGLGPEAYGQIGWPYPIVWWDELTACSAGLPPPPRLRRTAVALAEAGQASSIWWDELKLCSAGL